MAKGKRAKRVKDMSWRLELIRECHQRVLVTRAAEIEAHQKLAKKTRASERARAKKQKQVAIYITSILVRHKTPMAAHAVA